MVMVVASPLTTRSPTTCLSKTSTRSLSLETHLCYTPEPTEGAKPKKLAKVETPSRSPIAKHEAQNHAVYRSWCETCIKARSTGSIHRKRTAEEKVGRQLAATSSYFSQLRFWL